MSKSSSIQIGSVLTEFQAYTVVDKKRSTFIVKNAEGKSIELPDAYVDSLLSSAEYFTSTEKKTATELSELVSKNSFVAMSVAFTKKGKELTQKEYKQKIDSTVDKFEKATLSSLKGLVEDLISNPITKTEPGEFRVMKGYSLGTINSSGRLDFTDCEDPKGHILKQIDPRTIEYVIFKEVKYELK